MEHRIWISIPNMPFAREAQWLPLIEHLERTHAALGPVVSWDDETTMVIVLADETADGAAAAELGMSVVREALQAVALAERAPSVFSVQPVFDSLAA
jgi:hypothetical protein